MRYKVRWWWRWSRSASKRGMWRGREYTRNFVKGLKEGTNMPPCPMHNCKIPEHIAYRETYLKNRGD